MSKFEFTGNCNIYLQGDRALVVQNRNHDNGVIEYSVVDHKSKLTIVDTRRLVTAECNEAIQEQDGERFIQAFTSPAKVVIKANAMSALIHLKAYEDGNDTGLTLWLGTVSSDTMPTYPPKWTLIKQVNDLFAFVGLFNMDGGK